MGIGLTTFGGYHSSTINPHVAKHVESPFSNQVRKTWSTKKYVVGESRSLGEIRGG